jgi:hypothetical protein
VSDPVCHGTGSTPAAITCVAWAWRGSCAGDHFSGAWANGNPVPAPVAAGRSGDWRSQGLQRTKSDMPSPYGPGSNCRGSTRFNQAVCTGKHVPERTGRGFGHVRFTPFKRPLALRLKPQRLGFPGRVALHPRQRVRVDVVP